MKKIIAILLSVAMCLGLCFTMTACSGGADYTVGICQLMVHDSLDQATKGFKDALEEELEKEGKTVEFVTQVAGEANLCTTVVNTLVAKDVDLILGNATPALLAAANKTTSIPVLGTSVTDYNDTFKSGIPSNVTGTSDAVPFAEQADMMIDTLHLVPGDKVGVLYCSSESNSEIQYEAVRAEFESQGIVVEAYTFEGTTDLTTVVTNAVSAAENNKAIYVPSDNTVAANDTTVGTICSQNNMPVYTSYSSSICYASLAINYYELGRETGKMAAQILLGEKEPKDIAIKTLTPTRDYNEALCNQLDIAIPNEN